MYIEIYTITYMLSGVGPMGTLGTVPLGTQHFSGAARAGTDYTLLLLGVYGSYQAMVTAYLNKAVGMITCPPHPVK